MELFGISVILFAIMLGLISVREELHKIDASLNNLSGTVESGLDSVQHRLRL